MLLFNLDTSECCQDLIITIDKGWKTKDITIGGDNMEYYLLENYEFFKKDANGRNIYKKWGRTEWENGDDINPSAATSRYLWWFTAAEVWVVSTVLIQSYISCCQ